MVLILRSVIFQAAKLVLSLFWVNFPVILALKRSFQPGLHIVGGVDSSDPVYATVVTHYKWSKGWWWKDHYSRIQYCGGVIIDKNVVLTAAHCLYVTDAGGYTGIVPSKYVTVYTGSLTESLKDEKDTTVRSYVKSIEALELGRTTSFPKGHDLALLILKTSLSFDSHRQPVQPCNSSVEYNNTVHSLTVVGAGLEAHNKTPDHLQELEVESPDKKGTKKCANVYSVEDPESIVCFDGIGSNSTNRKNICSGDSGGPLILKTRRRPRTNICVYGITSFSLGYRCERNRYYAVATKVGYHLPWIESVLNGTM